MSKLHLRLCGMKFPITHNSSWKTLTPYEANRNDIDFVRNSIFKNTTVVSTEKNILKTLSNFIEKKTEFQFKTLLFEYASAYVENNVVFFLTVCMNLNNLIYSVWRTYDLIFFHKMEICS